MFHQAGWPAAMVAEEPRGIRQFCLAATAARVYIARQGGRSVRGGPIHL